MQTLYSVAINPNLIWDYQINEKGVKTESFFTWYLIRVLTHGTSKDIKSIPLYVIRKYLEKITLPLAVKKFWQWYLSYANPH